MAVSRGSMSYHWCVKDMPTYVKGCQMGVTYWSVKGMSWACHRCVKGVPLGVMGKSWMCEGGVEWLSRACHRCVKRVSWSSHGCVKKVSRGCYGGVKRVSWACHVYVKGV